MNPISPVTTHVLDIALGCPAEGIRVELEMHVPDAAESGLQWVPVGGGRTNSGGRVADLLPPGSLQQARYRISFDTGEYFASQNVVGFYPVVRIEFQIRNPDARFHVPLLLSPFGYSTYRGS